MKHNLYISISKKPKTSDIVEFKTITVREKLLRFLFGKKKKLTIIVPGGEIGNVTIDEDINGGEVNSYG